MDFNEASGNLTDLNGAVTYSIQVAAVTTFNDNEVIGDRSAIIERTTLEGGKQFLLLYIFCKQCATVVPTKPQSLNRTVIESNDMFNITLIWSRPDPPNGIITQYNVSNGINDYNNY